MPTKTYYGKLNCLSNPASKENIANEQYKAFCNFMSHLTGSGVVELISWNSGSGATSGSFETRTHWDGAKPFGFGAHSLWKMKSNTERPWDWYLYVQMVSGSAAVAAQTFNQPIVNYNSANMGNNSNLRGIIYQAAVCFSGSTSYNPWNGTISDGNSTAANPRWASGSIDRTMYLSPRSNDLGGSHVTSRNNSFILNSATINTSNQVMCQYIYDGDALYVSTDYNFSRATDVRYIGSFELNPSLSGSGICGSTKGFVNYIGTDSTNMFFTNTAFGDTAGTSGDPSGCIGIPLGIMVSGSRAGILQVVNNFIGSTYTPNQSYSFDEYPIYVGVSESPHFGFFGILNTGLIRATIGQGLYHTSKDNSRAVFGSNYTITNRKITIPWTGSYAPGYVGSTREGYTYTWIKDYG